MSHQYAKHDMYFIVMNKTLSFPRRVPPRLVNVSINLIFQRLISQNKSLWLHQGPYMVGKKARTSFLKLPAFAGSLQIEQHWWIHKSQTQPNINSLGFFFLWEYLAHLVMMKECSDHCSGKPLPLVLTWPPQNCVNSQAIMNTRHGLNRKPGCS